MMAIEIRGLSKLYKSKKRKTIEALSSLDLEISSGEVFGFLGPNGAGKSTTIKTLMGLILPTAGAAHIYGVPIIDAAARKRIGYLPENPSFYDFLTAREYLAFVGRTFGMEKAAIAAESDRVLRLMEIEDASRRSIRGYSKGMVQRLGLAQALLHDPDLYILDEPMSGLDPMGRALVKNIIKDIKARGKTVFFSTHITADVEIVCDRVGVIVDGKLKAIDTVEQILTTGIEGYYIRTKSGCHIDSISRFIVAKKSSAGHEFYVPKEEFKQFMKVITETGADVELIEPKRKDLEAFFLDIVSEKSK